MDKKNVWILLSWFVLIIIGVNGVLLPFQFFAFRFWSFLAIVSAILCGLVLNNLGKKYSVIIPIILIIAIFWSSGIAKWQLNTMSWENTAAEVKQYNNYQSWIVINNMPTDTKVFYPCRNDKNLDVFILGLDKYTCVWCKDEKDFKTDFTRHTPQELADFIRLKGYQYLFIDGNCLRDFNDNSTLLTQYASGIPLPVMYQGTGGVIWAVS